MLFPKYSPIVFFFFLIRLNFKTILLLLQRNGSPYPPFVLGYLKWELQRLPEAPSSGILTTVLASCFICFSAVLGPGRNSCGFAPPTQHVGKAIFFLFTQVQFLFCVDADCDGVFIMRIAGALGSPALLQIIPLHPSLWLRRIPWELSVLLPLSQGTVKTFLSLSDFPKEERRNKRKRRWDFDLRHIEDKLHISSCRNLDKMSNGVTPPDL